MFNRLESYGCYNEILNYLRSGKDTAVFGVAEGERGFIAAGIKDRFLLYVAPDFIEAKAVTASLNAFGGGYMYMPHKDDVLLYKKGGRRDIRAAALTAMSGYGGCKGVVVSIESLCQIYPDVDSFKSAIIRIRQRDRIRPRELAERLINAGYERTALVAAKGEFALRGDILDIFAPSFEVPVRIEFFGDDVESIRNFDLSTHRSADSVNEVILSPLFEIPPQYRQSALDKARACLKDAPHTAQERLRTVLGELEVDRDNDWLSPYAPNSRLFDYLPSNAIVIWQEPKHIADRIDRIYAEHVSRCGYLLEKGEITNAGINGLIPKERVTVVKALQASFSAIATQSFFIPKEITAVKSSASPSYKSGIDRLSIDVRHWIMHGYRIGIFTGDKANADRLRAELYENDCALRISDSLSDTLIEGAILALPCENGFISHSAKLVIIGQKQLYTSTARKKLRKASSAQLFTTPPEAGDYVVHDIHGIGICEGVTTLSGSFGDKDYIVVRYRNNDTLYVPVELSNLLSKYGGDTAPHLSALGGGEFERVKAKVKSHIKELSIDLVKLYNDRMKPRGYVYNCDKYFSDSFERAFPYVETEDQERCIQEVEKDLVSDKIMDRLLVGDVGFGKTEVAMRAAFRVAANGYQVAVLAPTTILSQQHYETFKARFEPFNLTVACLNRFRSAAEQRVIIQQVKEGKIDILVGTHRLLGKDVVFKKPGMLILDEEQRFGVEHKEKLKELKRNVDVLSMSATPIPRTLHMSLTGIRDISTISTPPKDRLPVESYIIEDSPALIRDVILREKARDGQIFIVYNRVQGIEEFAASVKALVPEISIIVGHGQMRESTLERNIYEFAHGTYDVLICTTIIENGIDMPNANTIIVYDADTLGLSQLYQLRGRVGRSNKLAFAYFIYGERKILSEVAYKRLTAIMENSELGSGFKLAMRDLEIRGAGNVLGREQHGHMEKVGYDMYLKLLSEVVAEAKGEPLPPRSDISLEIEMDANLPSEYIGDGASRMEFYSRMAQLSGRADKLALFEELKDVYGQPPQAVCNLLDIAEVKAYAIKTGAIKVIVKSNIAKIVYPGIKSLSNRNVMIAVGTFGKLIRTETDGDNIGIVFVFEGKSIKYKLSAVRAFCETVLGLPIKDKALDKTVTQ